jgi:hypothetical protein
LPARGQSVRALPGDLDGGRGAVPFPARCGFCVTDECDGASSPGSNACVGAWGATYLGFGHHGTPQGWYDWASGAFKVDYRGRRPVCGALGNCLGGTGHWTGTFVATPSPASPNLPPCLTKAGDTCNPSACAP